MGVKLPGQNDTFALVVQRVPGHFSRCPCGVESAPMNRSLLSNSSNTEARQGQYNYVRENVVGKQSWGHRRRYWVCWVVGIQLKHTHM